MTGTDTRPTRTHRLTVRGQKVTTRTPRRYAVVAVRPTEVRANDTGAVYVAFAEVRKRTDNINTARAEQRKIGYGAHTAFAVVIDLDTHQEV